MEARGFEPRSETGSTAASTCVAHRLRSPAAGQWAAHCWTSLLELRPSPEDAAPDYSDFAIPAKSPRTSYLTGRCVNRSYAARAKLELAVVTFPRDLPGLEYLGTRPRFHQPRRNQSPP